MVNPLVFPLLVFTLARRKNPGNDRVIRDAAKRFGKRWPQFREFTTLIAQARSPGKIIDKFLEEWDGTPSDSTQQPD